MTKKSKKEDVVEETTQSEEGIIEEEVAIPKEPTSEEIISELQEQIRNLKNELLKQHADLDNTKKRLEKERITERKYAALDVSKALLTPIDHLDLALNHVGDNELVQQFAQGIEMIKKQFLKVLEEEGVSEIDATNEEYDPNFHQAIMTEKIDGVEPNKVTEVLQKGYLFKDRLIRPAIVKISE